MHNKRTLLFSSNTRTPFSSPKNRTAFFPRTVSFIVSVEWSESGELQ